MTKVWVLSLLCTLYKGYSSPVDTWAVGLSNQVSSICKTAWEVKAGDLCELSKPSLHSEFQDSRGYVERPANQQINNKTPTNQQIK